MSTGRDSVFLKHLMDFNVVPIVIAGSDGRFFEVNDAFLDLIGYSREEFEAGEVNWRELTPAKYLPLDEDALEQMEHAPVADSYIKEYVRRDGSRVAIELFNGCDPENPGQIIGLIVEI